MFSIKQRKKIADTIQKVLDKFYATQDDQQVMVQETIKAIDKIKDNSHKGFAVMHYADMRYFFFGYIKALVEQKGLNDTNKDSLEEYVLITFSA